MKKLFLACVILFLACTVNSYARIGFFYIENSLVDGDQLIVPLDDFIVDVDDYGVLITANLLDSLTEEESYRIKVSHCLGGADNILYSYNIYATYTCNQFLNEEEMELRDHIDNGTLADEDGNGIYNIAGDVPYDEEDIMGDYEQDEYAAIIYRFGLHFVSENVDTSPILIEIYRVGEEDMPLSY